MWVFQVEYKEYSQQNEVHFENWILGTIRVQTKLGKAK